MRVCIGSMYKLEDQKFVTLQNTFEDYQHEMSLIEKVFVELIEFVDSSNDAQVLVKFEDIAEFIKRSFDKLEKMASSSLTQKKEIYIDDKLKPLILDTKKSMLLVNQFEMVPPSKEMFNVFDLKFLRNKTELHNDENSRATKMINRRIKNNLKQPEINIISN